MLTYFRINYLTNLTYFPIFPHYVDFSKVAAASPLAAAADRTTVHTVFFKIVLILVQLNIILRLIMKLQINEISQNPVL